MSIKQYKFCRIAITIALSASIAISITLENYYLPVIFTLSGAGALYACRKQLRTDKTLVDERDYRLAGKASRYTIFVYGWVGVIGTFALMALAPSKESFTYLLSQYMAFSVCFLFILNALIFKYLDRTGKND